MSASRLLGACLFLYAACGDDDAPPPGDVGPRTDGGRPDAPGPDAPGPMDAAADVPVGDDAMPPDGQAPDAHDPNRINADRPECENLNPVHCLLPWPSSRYLVADTSTESGYRMVIPPEALPTNQYGVRASPDAWEGFDGFSPMTSLMTSFPGDVDPSNLPDDARIEQSLAADSPTVLIDAETGERVAHMAELDFWPEADPTRRAFYIRPAVRLLEKRRYIVGIRNLRLRDGTPVAPSPYFRALRDRTMTTVAELEARRAEFESVFVRLENAGVARETLIEAWDFRTASDRSSWKHLIGMRDDAMMRIGADGTSCTVTRVEENPGGSAPQVARIVSGTFAIPLYMETPYEGTRAHRDAMGNVAFNGMAEAPFTFVIPRAVETRMMAGGDPVRLLVYGHGLLGTGRQTASSGTRTFLEAAEMVGVGTDWQGMSEADEAIVVNEWITDVGKFPLIGERLMQGVLNFAVLARTFLGACRDLPELQIGGRSPIAGEAYYYGISQGGIMGASLAGISPDIDRYALQVGAISYPMMIRRSVDFRRFEGIFRLWYPDKLDRDWALVASQNGWDLAEPATFARHLLSDPLPGSDTKRILYQVSLHDTEVSNQASDVAARTMGLPWFRSSVYEPWRVTRATDGPEDSGYFIYHVRGVAPIPRGSAIAATDNVAHSDLRYAMPVIQQLDAFMRPDGRVQNFCGGLCTVDMR